MQLVGVRGVSKVFANGVKALAEVSLDVQAGAATQREFVLALELVGTLEEQFHVAVDVQVAGARAHLALDLQTLHRRQLVFSADRLACLGEQRRALGGVLGRGGRRERQRADHS